MTCVGPSSSCCCAALLSWGATTRRAQQQLRRCNLGESDSLLFVFFLKTKSTARRLARARGVLCWRPNVCPRRGSVGLFYVCVFPSAPDDRVFGSRRWARLKWLSGEDKGVECRPAVPSLPVGSTWSSCKFRFVAFWKFWIEINKSRFVCRLVKCSSWTTAAFAPLLHEFHQLRALVPARISSGCKQTQAEKESYLFVLLRRVCVIAVAVVVRAAHGVSLLCLSLNYFTWRGSSCFILRSLFVWCERRNSHECAPYLTARWSRGSVTIPGCVLTPVSFFPSCLPSYHIVRLQWIQNACVPQQRTFCTAL